MNQTDALFAKADALAGKIATVVYSKPQKVKKSFADLNLNIVKRSTFQVRVGLEYANQATVKEGHEKGTIERQGLPESLVKISRSRYRNTKRNVDVLAVAPVHNPNAIRETSWLLDGNVVPFEQVEQYLYAQRKSDESPAWFTLDFDCVESLSGVY